MSEAAGDGLPAQAIPAQGSTGGATRGPAGRGGILRDAVSIGIAVAAYGLALGAVGVASGLSVLQTQATSALMFTGASQFALIGVLGAGGSGVAAVATAGLLGVRNALYGLRLAPLLQVRGVHRFVAAHLTIDESTAMAMAHESAAPASHAQVGADGTGALADPEQRGARLAFWATGLAVFLLWNAATAIGALGAGALGDPAIYGLDAAIPAGFLALLWPRLRPGGQWPREAVVAGLGGLLALALTPLLPPGVPVLAAGLVALVFARWRIIR